MFSTQKNFDLEKAFKKVESVLEKNNVGSNDLFDELDAFLDRLCDKNFFGKRGESDPRLIWRG